MVFKNIPYEHPLIIGTGGGNDIVSATLVLSDLSERGIKADLAGMCSPGAWHTYNGEEEKPINEVTENTKRYRPSKEPLFLSFIDARVPSLLNEKGLDAQVYHLSCRHGTARLIEGLQRLVQERGYDGIIAVDVGGDILARGKEDPTILSPLMDFTALYAISQLDTPSVLIEFGLQTDGELRPNGCTEILAELRSQGLLRETFKISNSDACVNTFREIYAGIEHIRHGHTATMTLKTLEAQNDLKEMYGGRVHVLDKKWHYHFPITLESKYFGKVFVIDLKGLEKSRKLAFPYENPLELLLKTKRIVDIKTEMDMLYARVNNTSIWLGLLCPQVQGNMRQEIINYGVDKLNNHADVALLWKRDSQNRIAKQEIGDFVLVGEEKTRVKEAAKGIKAALRGKHGR